MGESAAGDATAPERLFVDLSHWRKIAVSGPGVLVWLGALVTADLSDVAPGRAVHAQLTPAAGDPDIRFTVAAPGGSLLLLQDPEGAAVDAALSPHAAPADIVVQDRTAELALFAFPGRSRPPTPRAPPSRSRRAWAPAWTCWQWPTTTTGSCPPCSAGSRR